MSPSTSGAIRRDAVHHLLVHRRAQRRRIAAIALERRLGARRPAPASPPPRRGPPSSRLAPTIAASSASTSATSAFAARIRSISAGDLQTITVRPRVLRRRSPRQAPHRPPPSPRPAAGCRRSTGTSAAPSSTRRAASSAAGTPSAAPARSRRHRPTRVTSAAAALAARRPSSPARAFEPHLLQIRRVASRRTSTSSGTTMSSTTSGPRRPPSDRAPSPARPSAESRRARTRTRASVAVQPILARCRSSRRRRPGCPASIVVLRRRGPSSVPAWTASRRMSPVEIFGSRARAREPLRLRALARPRRAEHHDVQRRRSSLVSRHLLSPPSPDPRLLHEPVVVAHDELRLDLLHGVHRDADDDEQRRAAEVELRRSCPR